VVDVRLAPLDEGRLREMLTVAVAGATPAEVMPPVDGSPGWTEANREAFVTFHRQRHTGLDGPTRTVMHAVLVDGTVAGMIRMTVVEPGTVETGMWLARWARGRGLGTAALAALLERARAAGADRVVADTTPDNAPALAALRGLGATLRPDDDKVSARFDLGR
jgi:RimJ/RimL family protein N-acetyltransferase